MLFPVYAWVSQVFCSCQVSWLKFHTHVIFPSHPISLDSVIYVIFPEQQKLRSSSLCNFHHLPITSLSSLTPLIHAHLLWWQCHTHLKHCAKLDLYKKGCSRGSYGYWNCAVWKLGANILKENTAVRYRYIPQQHWYLHTWLRNVIIQKTVWIFTAMKILNFSLVHTTLKCQVIKNVIARDQ
jgi:hypothetical protein